MNDVEKKTDLVHKVAQDAVLVVVADHLGRAVPVVNSIISMAVLVGIVNNLRASHVQYSV